MIKGLQKDTTFETSYATQHCLVTQSCLTGTPWIVAHQAPLSLEFSREEYWSGYPFPSPGDLHDPGIELASPVLAGWIFTTEPAGKPTTQQRST